MGGREDPKLAEWQLVSEFKPTKVKMNTVEYVLRAAMRG
jgi:hypothetical protein